MQECEFKHCENKEIAEDELMIYRGKPYHKKCYDDMMNIREIKKEYVDHISSTVVQKMLGKVVNDIIFKKHVSSDFFLYSIKYAITNKITITNPFGLHYLIDNKKIKDAYEKQQSKTIKEGMKVNITCENNDEVTFSIKKDNNVQGFGSILKGGK